MEQTLQALRNLLQAVPLWLLSKPSSNDETALGTIATASSSSSSSSFIESVREHESVEQARAGAIMNVVQRNVQRAVLYSSGRSGEADWRELERRYYWGGLEVPPALRSGFQSTVQNGSPESMDVEMEFQSGRRSHEGTTGGGEEAAAGFLKLVDVILSKLEGSPSGDGCDETTSAVSLASFTVIPFANWVRGFMMWFFVKHPRTYHPAPAPCSRSGDEVIFFDSPRAHEVR